MLNFKPFKSKSPCVILNLFQDFILGPIFVKMHKQVYK